MQLLGPNGADEPLAVIQAFAASFQLTFPILRDANSAYNQYGQNGSASPYPLDYVIDQSGNVAFFATEYEPEALVAAIDQLLGNVPVIDVDPPEVDFGSVPIGQSENRLVTVTNSGPGELLVTDIVTGGGLFTANLDELTVPPGGSRALQVTFTPAEPGPAADLLQLSSNDPTAPLLAIALAGVGAQIVAVDAAVPSVLSLDLYPNPLNPRATLRFSIPAPGQATLVVYDLKGSAVRHLLAAVHLPAGLHTTTWDGNDDTGSPLPSGVYFARLRTAGRALTVRATLVR